MGSPEDPGRICYIKADLAKRSIHIINLLPRLADPHDIVLINIGIHYNDMYELSEDMTMEGYALTQPGLPKNVFWVESGPQHYETSTGTKPTSLSGPQWINSLLLGECIYSRKTQYCDLMKLGSRSCALGYNQPVDIQAMQSITVYSNRQGSKSA